MPDNTVEEPTITRELAVPPVEGPPLDPTLFAPNDVEREFLAKAVSPDEDEMRRRVANAQKASYEEYQYPCIRGFHHVALLMLKNPIYNEVLQLGKDAQAAGDSPLFLDLGCCLGSDARKLIMDGYPSDAVIGCDLRKAYIDIGHILYGDAGKTPVRFIVSDIFDLPLSHTLPPPISAAEINKGEVKGLGDLTGRLSVAYAGALFHLFNEATQFALALRLITLLRRPDGTKRPKKVIIFGRHQGLAEAGMIPDWMGRERYGHSPESWEAMWKRAFAYFTPAESEGKWPPTLTVQSHLTGHLQGIPGDDVRMLVWSVSVNYEE